MAFPALFNGLSPSLSASYLSALPPNHTFTRSTNGTNFNNAANLVTAAIDAPRFDFNPTTLAPNGLLIEAASTNQLRNSVLAGAVTGTPGTLPTNWSGSLVAAGLTQQIVATGTFQGIPFFDMRVFGTTVATSVDVLFCELSGIIAATTGQTWNNSFYLALVGGSFANISTFDITLRENDSLNAFLRQTLVDVRSATSTWRRFSVTQTMGASTAFLVPAIRASYNLGVAVDFTLRIGGIQAEQTAFPTSLVQTSGAATTRALDDLTINSLPPFNINAGSFYAEVLTPPRDTTNSQMLFQFDDGTVNNALRAFLFSTDGSLRFESRSAAVGTVANSAVVPATGSIARVACSYTSGRIGISANGSAVGIAAPAALPVGPFTNFRLGRSTTITQFLNGHLRRFAYWPYVLPDATLQQISTTGAF